MWHFETRFRSVSDAAVLGSFACRVRAVESKLSQPSLTPRIHQVPASSNGFKMPHTYRLLQTSQPAHTFTACGLPPAEVRPLGRMCGGLFTLESRRFRRDKCVYVWQWFVITPNSAALGRAKQVRTKQLTPGRVQTTAWAASGRLATPTF